MTSLLAMMGNPSSGCFSWEQRLQQDSSSRWNLPDAARVSGTLLCAGQPLPPQPPHRILHARNLQELFHFGRLNLSASSGSNLLKEAEDRVHDLFLGKPSNSSFIPVGALMQPPTLDVLLVKAIRATQIRR